MKNNVPNSAKKLMTTTAVPIDSDRLANRCMRQQRLLGAQFDHDEHRQRHEAGQDDAEGLAGQPTPGLRLDQAEHDEEQPARQGGDAGDVHAGVSVRCGSPTIASAPMSTAATAIGALM